MSENKPIAIVLGGTNPHIELIKKLKLRGYWTVLIDYLPNPPAKEYADEHVQESTLDKDFVAKYAAERNAKLIITTNIDQANVSACYASEKNGLNVPYSYETALNVTDKSRMKKIMVDNNIPTSKYIETNCLAEVEDELDLTYPIILKPTDSNGSRGVHRADNFEELRYYFNIAKEAGRSKNVIIEEFVTGVEVSFYYYVKNCEANFIYGYKRYNFKIAQNDVVQSTGVAFPADISERAYENMHSAANKIAKAFVLNNTPLFIQAIVSGNEISVLEFAPRIGGGLSYRVIERDCKFDLISAAIDSFEGKPVELKIQRADHISAILNIYAPGIVMGEIKGVNEILDNNIANEFYQYRLKGAEVSGDMSSGSRVGAFLICADNIADIRRSVRDINRIVEVYDEHQNASMRHDIYDIWEK